MKKAFTTIGKVMFGILAFVYMLIEALLPFLLALLVTAWWGFIGLVCFLSS